MTTEPPRISSLSELAPSVALRAFALVELARKAGHSIGVFETYRTAERQAWLYAQGRTRPGKIISNAPTVETSWHGYGLAFDIAFLSTKANWYWPADISVWKSIADLAAPLGLASGINWRNPDAPHYQPVNLKVSPSIIGKTGLREHGREYVWKITGHHVVSSELLSKLKL